MMKRMLMGLCAVCLVGVAVAWSGQKAVPPEFAFRQEARNPVSHLRLNNDPNEFQFAIVSDRTGGHRSRIFSRAVEQLNLLQPEFVVSVGDLIEGYTENKSQLNREWLEFQTYVSRLQMPFFYVPGNHDITNFIQDRIWRERFGRRYYDFVYRNVLFLLLNSEDPPSKDHGNISAEQHVFIRRSVETNREARHILVFLHKPMWDSPTVASNGWLEVEKILSERPYTVFAGHIHKYQKFSRNGRAYYQLATTGGDSKMRGPEYREFDHIVWLTMKKDGPVLANILLDGVLPEDLKTFETAEEGVAEYYRQPPQPVTGRITLKGKPVPQAYVVFQSTLKERPPRADAITAADGSFTLSTYRANDGAPAGEYVVSVVQRKPFFDESGKPGPNQLPAVYAGRDSSPVRAVVTTGQQVIDIDL